MSNELVPISPEGVEIANAYITLGNINGVCDLLKVSREKVQHYLNTREVKRYIDTAYLDTGYRNRNNIASLLDEMIESKLLQAQESGVYSKKDLADLISLAHKIRMDEEKLRKETENTSIKNQANIQINEGMPFGSGNYGNLIKTLLEEQNE